jgi:hypothetical protein
MQKTTRRKLTLRKETVRMLVRGFTLETDPDEVPAGTRCPATCGPSCETA